MISTTSSMIVSSLIVLWFLVQRSGFQIYKVVMLDFERKVSLINLIS